MSVAPGPVHELFALLHDLGGEIEDVVPVVRIELEDGSSLDVFRAEQVRERPIAWRVRGFIDDAPPRELVALVLGTVDGRASLMMAASDAAIGPGGNTVRSASRANRRLADLAEVIARRVRERFGNA